VTAPPHENVAPAEEPAVPEQPVKDSSTQFAGEVFDDNPGTQNVVVTQEETIAPPRNPNVRTVDTQTHWDDIASEYDRPPSESWNHWLPPPPFHDGSDEYTRYHCTSSPVPPPPHLKPPVKSLRIGRLQVATLPIDISTRTARRPGTASKRGTSRNEDELRLTHKTYISCYGERMTADALSLLQNRIERQSTHKEMQNRRALPTLQRLCQPKHTCKQKHPRASPAIVLEYKRKGMNAALFSKSQKTPSTSLTTRKRPGTGTSTSAIASARYQDLGQHRPRLRPMPSADTFGLFPSVVRMDIGE